ncbi:MAG: hypothetical protein ACKOXO_03345 [Cyanobium sp.]
MLIHACLSSHGFGHGSRSVAVLCELAARRPDWRLVISSGLPPAFLRLAFGAVPFEHRPQRWDVGMVQSDALAVDVPATLAALDTLERELPERIAAEVSWLRQQRQPVLLLGDVPPATALIAAELGAPLVWLASFGWDAIYAPFGGALAERAQRYQALYGRGTLLLHCPLSLPMPWGIPEQRLGLTCSRPRLDGAALARRLQLPPERERCVLLSFGGLGLALEPSLLERWPDHVFIGTDPGLAAARNGRVLPPDVRPLDGMPLVSRLITKAGYSSFCEAFSQGVGIHLVERRDFAEAPVLAEALQDHGDHRLLRLDQFLGGDWELDLPLQPPRLGPLGVDGAAQAAAALESQALQAWGD